MHGHTNYAAHTPFGLSAMALLTCTNRQSDVMGRKQILGHPPTVSAQYLIRFLPRTDAH